MGTIVMEAAGQFMIVPVEFACGKLPSRVPFVVY